MKKLKNFLIRVYHVRAMKYVVVAVVAVVLIGFVDENSVWSHVRNEQRISELEEEIKEYSDQNRHNQEQIKMLDRDPKAIQRIARERYFMKADDEDIFVLSDDQEYNKQKRSDETAE